MGKRGPKPKIYNEDNWSVEMAYAIGLITSDGCLSKDGRHIDLTSKDLEQIRTFQRCLSLGKICIGRKSSGSRKDNSKKYYRIQWGDVGLYRWLVSIGLSSNKSKILNSLTIPDIFFFDFLRGLWDGDGCIYSYWDPRWRSSFTYYISFASASPVFLKWVNDTIYKLINIRGKITKMNSAEQLKFAKEGSKILFKKMFYKNNLPHLKRKFAKATKIFKIDDDHNKMREW